MGQELRAIGCRQNHVTKRPGNPSSWADDQDHAGLHLNPGEGAQERFLDARQADPVGHQGRPG